MLGSLLIALVALLFGAMTAELATVLASFIALGIALESIGLLAHAKDLKSAESEGAASFYEQTTTYGKAYWLRNSLLAIAFITSVSIALTANSGLIGFGLLTALLLNASIIGRALFYVLVIPTTMPGAFFWKNKGFVEHARETGLADMQQLGVAYEQHHPFNVDELLETIKSTTLKEKIEQAKRIITG